MTELPEDPGEALAAIHDMKQEGRLFAELEDGEREYVLIAHEIYPNGTTSDGVIEDPEVGEEIGRRMGIGPPTDGQGWAIWLVPPTHHQEES